VGLRPEEEFLANSGYCLDARVEVNGTVVGVEVDGPYFVILGLGRYLDYECLPVKSMAAALLFRINKTIHCRVNKGSVSSECNEQVCKPWIRRKD
jgi:hypothetical protein